MDCAALLQVVATAGLNASFAWLTGLLFTRHVLATGLPAGGSKALLAGALASLPAGAALLWALAAQMGATGLDEAVAMIWPVALGTAAGRSVLAAMASLLLAAWLLRRWPVLGAVMLLGFVLARAAVSHGAEGGVLTLGYVMEAAHLLLVGIWLGAVAVAACCSLNEATVSGQAGYLGRLSGAATLALAGIVATGVWNSWHRLSTPSDLWRHPWGMLLAVKLGLFSIAALLGAWNRWVGFPRALAGQARPARLVLRIETVVLCGTLIAAAALVSRQPPP